MSDAKKIEKCKHSIHAIESIRGDAWCTYCGAYRSGKEWVIPTSWNARKPREISRDKLFNIMKAHQVFDGDEFHECLEQILKIYTAGLLWEDEKENTHNKDCPAASGKPVCTCGHLQRYS